MLPLTNLPRTYVLWPKTCLCLSQMSALRQSTSRSTSIFAPVPMPPSMEPYCRLELATTPMEIILQPERSTRWPDDLEAIQKLKLAFYERLADGLTELVPGTRAAVVLKDALSKTHDQSHLDIFTSSGWTFSARIWHDRELDFAHATHRDISSRTRQDTAVGNWPGHPKFSGSAKGTGHSCAAIHTRLSSPQCCCHHVQSLCSLFGHCQASGSDGLGLIGFSPDMSLRRL